MGSNLSGNNIRITSGKDINVEGSNISANTGITLAAMNDINLLAATETYQETHRREEVTNGLITGGSFGFTVGQDRQTTQTDIEGANQSQSRSRLGSTTGNILLLSGGNTLIEAGKLNAGGNINLNAGYDANGNLLNPDAAITFAAVKDSDYLNTEDKHRSLSWQNQSGSGHNTETIRLANIKAGKGINVNATGGVMVDIPEVPKPVAGAAPQVDENGKPLPPPLTPEELAARHKADLNKQLDALATQPGQEWIGQLARKVKEKPDQFKFREVAAAAEHWNYSQEGLTPEAAAVIAIAVTYGTAGVAGSAAGSMTGAAAGTTTVASAAVAAGMTTLASQATISLINNKGHVGKTLEELGRKESVKQVVAAMITAGVAGSYGRTFNLERFGAQTLTGCVTGNMTGRGCESGAATAAILTGLEWGNHIMRTSMIKDSETFKGVTDANDPSGRKYSNVSGQDSAGIDGSGDRVAGTRISIKKLEEYGTMTPVTPEDTNTLWTFTGKPNPLTEKPYTLTEALTAQGGATGGTQALSPTFAGIPVARGSFLDKLQESYAGPHDYLGGRIQGGYDSFGNWSVDNGLGAEIMSGVNIPLVTPLAIPTLLRQLHVDPVTIDNIVQSRKK